MKQATKILFGIMFSFLFCFLCVGYASPTNSLRVVGDIDVPLPQAVYITKMEPLIPQTHCGKSLGQMQPLAI